MALLEAGGHDETLLVLDNCEHLVDEVVSLVVALVERTSYRVVATSREPLDVPDERVFRLTPFETDGDPSPAAQLLAAMIEARGITDEFSKTDLEALASRLDGLPLALELASARIRSMSPSEVAAHLDARLDLLTRSRKRGPERHQSLRAAIAWSYDLLTDDERRFLRIIGTVFESGFIAEMAAAAVDVSIENALAVLQSLVDRSMLAVQRLDDRSWYRPFDTVRTFVREMPAIDDVADADDRVTDAVASVSMSLADPANPSPTAGRPQSVQALLPATRAAVEFAVAADEGPERAYQILAPMWWVEDTGHQADVAAMIADVLARWPGPMDRPRSDLAGIRASLLRVSGFIDEAHAQATDVIAAGIAGTGLALSHRTLGFIIRNAGDFSGSVAEFERGALIAAEIGDHTLAQDLEMHIALDTARSGDLAAGIERLRRSVLEADPGSLVGIWTRVFLGYLYCWRRTTKRPPKSWRPCCGATMVPSTVGL